MDSLVPRPRQECKNIAFTERWERFISATYPSAIIAV
jgi:hypothetical protein